MHTMSPGDRMVAVVAFLVRGVPGKNEEEEDEEDDDEKQHDDDDEEDDDEGEGYSE